MASSVTGSPRCLHLAGCTAVGKSEVALLLAECLGGEIVSVDSMQVYRGLDIGTAKPSAAERARVPHHLIDIATLSEAFDAGKFVALANAAIAGIQQRGRVPILCGGTGLYFKALLSGLGEAPPTDPAVRAALETAPLDDLLRELAVSDPETFARIDQKNPRRVIRALEVIRLTGRPFSAQRAPWKAAAEAAPGQVEVFGLRRPVAALRTRIDFRVEQMFGDGLVAETQRMLAEGLERNSVAMQAIGYRQVVEHLRGERSLPETIELVKIRTRQFAKRQMTWFRGQLPMRWMDVESKETADELAGRLIAAWKHAPEQGTPV